MASPIGRTFMLVITDEHAKSLEWLHAKTLEIADQLSDWGIIHHDLDQGTPHYHVAIKYKTPTRLSAVATHYEQAENLVKLWRRDEGNMWAYMTHQTKNAKAAKVDYQPYLDDLAKSIWSSEHLKNKARYNPTKNATADKNKIEKICKQILLGNINERQLLGEDLILTYWQHKTKIDQAIQLRTKSLKYNPPDCVTYLITGYAGTGKTRYATELAKELYPDDWAMASSKNDPLQDYQGEKCLIFDDFRPKDLELNALLALLDPYYRQRTHQSRYYNKPLATQLIIITTVNTLDDIINHYTDFTNEDPKQIRRRISRIITISDSEDPYIEIYDEQMDGWVQPLAPETAGGRGLMAN